MNSENSKTFKPHVLTHNKIDLRISEIKHCFIKSLYLLYLENIKSSPKENNFKISAWIWNDEFELLDGSYLIPDIPDYFEYILKTYLQKNNDFFLKNIYK